MGRSHGHIARPIIGHGSGGFKRGPGSLNETIIQEKQP
jgi:hypothetical protein